MGRASHSTERRPSRASSLHVPGVPQGESVHAEGGPFGNFDLSPASTYTICETDVPSGWTSEWMIDTNGDGTAHTAITPYNPNADDPIPKDLGNRCFDFGAGTSAPLTAGGTLVFQVNNTFPGGDARTPGYWNFAAGAASCQAAQDAALAGQALLDSFNFTGTGSYLDSKVKGAKLTQRQQALALAKTLDEYNNNLC